MQQAPFSSRCSRPWSTRDILSNAEARILLTKAAGDLGPHEYVAPVKGAMGIILNDLLPIFPEDGGD